MSEQPNDEQAALTRARKTISQCVDLCHTRGCGDCVKLLVEFREGIKPEPPPEADLDAHPGHAHVRASELARRARPYVRGDVTSTNVGKVPGLTNRD